MNELTVFLSAVTGEFRNHRDRLRHQLTRPNVSVKVQEDFVGTGTTTLEKLDTYIRECDVVIHLIGAMTGSMADAAAVADIRKLYPDFAAKLPAVEQALGAGTPLSYTQWEAYLAIYHGKRLLLAKAAGPTRADLSDQEALQVAHVGRLQALGRYVELPFEDASELVIGVYRSAINDTLAEATGRARARVAIGTLRRDYAAAVVDKFCRIDRVGFSVSGAFAEALAASEAFAGQRFRRTDDPTGAVLTIDDIARAQRFVIVGGGGAGKSSVLKQILACAGGDARRQTPVFISLGDLTAKAAVTPGSFIGYLLDQAATELSLPGADREFFDTILAEGDVLVGFDALDECGSVTRRQQARELIVTAARKWPRCRFVLTSRTETLALTPFPRSAGAKSKNNDQNDKDVLSFGVYEIAPFSRQDIAPFLEVAFGDDGSLTDEILGRTDIDALTATPLTLTLLALVARAGGGLPSNRTDLFASCADTVTRTWEDDKKTDHDDLTAEWRTQVLQGLGWEAQRLGVDALEAHEARAAITEYTELSARSEVKSALDWLSRRSVLLQPEFEPGASTDLRRLTFRHLQFREHLAGARLAEWWHTDPGIARAHLSEHCLDAAWTATLQFFLGTIRREPHAIDTAFETIWNADPYRDLLYRPAFVLGGLLAELDDFRGDSQWVQTIVETLDRLAREDPALSEDAAQTLLELWRHPAAVVVLGRWAGGMLPGALIDSKNASPAFASPLLTWRLRAIQSLASATGAGAALQALAAVKVSDREEQLAVLSVQARLGDSGATAALLEHFQDAPVDRPRIAGLMDEIGAGSELDRWISDRLDNADTLEVSIAVLARGRNLLQDGSPSWRLLLERAEAELARQPRNEEFAPTDLTEAIYVSEPLYEAIQLPAARELLKESLNHRAFIWFSSRVVMKLMPDLEEEVMRALLAYVTADDPKARDRGAESRFADALSQLAAIEADDKIVPVFLQLLGSINLLGRVWHPVAESLRVRGRVAEALAVLFPQIRVPDGIDDANPDEYAEHRSNSLSAAELISPGATVAWLEAAYRGSPDDVANARRLASLWRVSGLGTERGRRMKQRKMPDPLDPARLLNGAIAQGWFERIAGQPDGRTFLEALIAHAAETTLGELARRALQPPPEESIAGAATEPPEPTLPELESQFEALLSEKDESGLSEMTVLESIRDLGGYDLALRYAGRWLKTEPSSDGHGEGVPASLLARRLRSLSAVDLRDPSWLDLAAETARRLPPEQRGELVKWIRENVG